MKKMKKIMAAAIAMMTFSTAAAVTGTVAWFTANNIVSAQGMNIQAEAEEGIVLAKELASYTDADWSIDVTASHDGSGLTKGFIPTSTANASAWYHANSDKIDDYTHTGDYATLEVNAPTINTGDGVAKATVNNIADRNIYLLNHFKLQASGNTPLADQDLFVKEVKAEDSTADEKAKALNKSLRVLFKLNGGNTLIYAPLATHNKVHDGATLDTDVTPSKANGKIAGTTTLTAYYQANSAATDKLLDNQNIPAYLAAGTNALDISVYCYFEGEDVNCKSANIAEFKNIAISFKLENKPHNA